MKNYTLALLASLSLGISLTQADSLPLSFKKGEHIVLLGNGRGYKSNHQPRAGQTTRICLHGLLLQEMSGTVIPEALEHRRERRFCFRRRVM